MVLFGEARGEAVGEDSPFTRIDGGGELEAGGGGRGLSLRMARSALRSLLPLDATDDRLMVLPGGDAPSSASSLISFKRFEEIAGEAVCSGKTAAKAVSLRPSGEVNSRSVS